eukprot:TRINITY_DN36663_c0_g1_i2.p1 TRINITY_DN36663_c0_g1~~TRINITY_DN36663_c0_g1_i2.p1  ORF type:complete len:584 (-),score=79.72 TRINITY_DN36663_c0_g1_i2:70-1821(-)
MKYFESYLKGVTSNDDVDISVHCDIAVFEWLLAYMEDPGKVNDLEVGSVVSILISSEFLQMHQLVEQCLAFMKIHLEQVVRLPTDMGCLSPNMVRRLAYLCTDEELDAVRDRRDRLLGRLFASKLERLLEQDGLELERCLYCQRLFTKTQKELLLCPKAPAMSLGFRGRSCSYHVADKEWDVNRYVRRCHKRLGHSWRELYWRLWGAVQLLHCSICQQHFSGTDFERCSYHAEDPVWQVAPQSHIGLYPCCRQTAYRFSSWSSGPVLGCCAKAHEPGQSDVAAVSLADKIVRHRELICVPFQAPARELQPGFFQPGLTADRSENEDEEGRATAESPPAEDLARGRRGGASDFGFEPSDQYWALYCFDPPPEHQSAALDQERNEPSTPGRLSQQRPRKRSVSANRRRADRSDAAAEDVSPAPAAALFDASYPPHVAPQKRMDHRLDILREDDRRQMEGFVARIHSHRRSAAAKAAAQSKKDFEWISEYAAAAAAANLAGNSATAATAVESTPTSRRSGDTRRTGLPEGGRLRSDVGDRAQQERRAGARMRTNSDPMLTRGAAASQGSSAAAVRRSTLAANRRAF